MTLEMEKTILEYQVDGKEIRKLSPVMAEKLACYQNYFKRTQNSKLWKVKISTVFTSSQGMKTYTVDQGESEVYVCAPSDSSLSWIKKRIAMAFSDQIQVHLLEVTYIESTLII